MPMDPGHLEDVMAKCLRDYNRGWEAYQRAVAAKCFCPKSLRSRGGSCLRCREVDRIGEELNLMLRNLF